VIALARLGGDVRGIVWEWPRQQVLRCLSLFEPGPVTSGLGTTVLFAVFGAAVLQIRPGEPPSPGGGLTILTAVAVQGMTRGETTIASLEQTLSGRKTRQFGLRTAWRGRILELGQGER